MLPNVTTLEASVILQSVLNSHALFSHRVLTMSEGEDTSSFRWPVHCVGERYAICGRLTRSFRNTVEVSMDLFPTNKAIRCDSFAHCPLSVQTTTRVKMNRSLCSLLCFLMVLLLASHTIKHTQAATPVYTCYGIASTNASVCSGRGTCVANNASVCPTAMIRPEWIT